MTMRLMIRGFRGRVLQWAKPLTVEALDGVLPALAEEHASAMANGLLGMIEIEFLDEPDPNERFFRIGTDPSGMVKPMEYPLHGRDRAN